MYYMSRRYQVIIFPDELKTQNYGRASINNCSLLLAKNMFLGKQKFDVKQLKLNKFLFDNKQLKINKFIFEVKHLKMNRFIKFISDLIISTSNATLELLSLRPWQKFKKSHDHNLDNTCMWYKIKTNPNMCLLMYFKIQSDQPRITRNAFKKVKFSIYLLNHHQDINKIQLKNTLLNKFYNK